MKNLSYVLLFLSLPLFAQNYKPIDTLDNDQRIQNKNLYIASVDNLLNNIGTNYKGKTKKKLIKLFNDYKIDFSKKIDKGQFIYKTILNDKISEIYNEIHLKNNIVPSNLNILLSKDIALNAYCMPDGTMAVNSGTIYYLENEDQLASIICHEIGHYLLKHTLNRAIKNIEDTNSKSTKKKVNTIKKSRYNRNKKAVEMLKKVLYSKSKNNRKNEFQADSIGYELLKRTKYNKLSAINSIGLILFYDTIKPNGLNNNIYKKVFDLPKLAFQNKWLNQEDFSKYDYSLYKDVFSKDSLKSHPEAIDRINYLKSTFSELNNKTESLNASIEFKNLQEMVKNNQVANLFFQKEYGTAIYLSLLRIQEGYLVDYHKKWLGINFAKIYEARKNYKANKYLEIVKPKTQSKSYQQFLNFMWNLNLEEINTIANYYLN